MPQYLCTSKKIFPQMLSCPLETRDELSQEAPYKKIRVRTANKPKILAGPGSIIGSRRRTLAIVMADRVWLGVWLGSGSGQAPGRVRACVRAPRRQTRGFRARVCFRPEMNPKPDPNSQSLIWAGKLEARQHLPVTLVSTAPTMRQITVRVWRNAISFVISGT